MDWKKLAWLIRGLREQEDEPEDPLFCPTKDSFRIPSEREIIGIAVDAALEAGSDEVDYARFSIPVRISEDVPKGFVYDDPEEWKRRCPDSIKSLKDAVLAPLHKFGRDEVGSVERVKGRGPTAYVVAAPVYADFGESEIEGIDIDLEEGDIVISFNVAAPIEIGEFGYAYP